MSHVARTPAWIGLAWCAALAWSGLLPAATEYTVADGLSQNSALALARDDDGYLWIGTEDGLNRFDGYEFRVYRPSDRDPGATASAYIRDIAVGGRYLYLATNGGGLSIFDRVSARFRAVGVADGLPAEHYNAVDLPQPGTLYLASRSGLHRVDWQGDPLTASFTVRPIAVGADPPRRDIWELRRGPSGLWVGSGDGAFRVDADDRVQALDISGAERPFNIDSLLEVPAGTLWIGTWNHGLYRVELASGRTRRFLPGNPDSPGLRTRRILKLAAGPGGSVYIGSDRGLAWFDPVCDCVKALDHRRSARVAGRGFLVEALDVDERGGVFAGHWGEGLVRFTPSDLVFHVERHRDEGAAGLAQGRVRALLEDSRGDLWVGSYGGGVQRVAAADRRDGIAWPFQALPIDGAPEGARLVWSLLQDRAGRVWAATEEGLYWTDPERPQWRREPALPASLRAGSTRVMLEDVDGRLWVGSSSGLWRFDAFGEPRRPVPLARAGAEEPWFAQQDRSIYALHRDSEQRIWVGTSGGLHILDADGTPLARYRVADGLPGAIVWDIHRHADGTLYIGSNGGLARIVQASDVAALRFEPIGRLASLPSGMIYAIASDRQGQLWLTSNRGLIRFDPASLRHRVWRRRDGIASDEFASGAVAAGSQGWLYFGGIDGLTAVQPERLRDLPEPPRPSLARATIGDAELPPAAGPTQLPQLDLQHGHAPLIVDFTGLVYDSPGAVRFRYRLDPTATFHELGTRRSLILDRLPYGEHGLELRVDNEDRSATRELLQIRVAPPYWGTWTFRLAAGTALVLLLTAAYLLRTRQLLRQQRKLEAEVGARTRELRNQKEALQATAEALATANAKLRTLSTIDPLTGLPNRRELIERIARWLAEPQPLALSVIDLDQFKRINDEHGHLAGDAVLRDFGALATSLAQRREVIGRWGGEEFLALLPGADGSSAQAWADELLARVRSRRVATGTGSIGYRISLGVALATAGDDMDALVARADRALYQAKEAGRDRAVVG
ncbi:MAG: diguanylate cyclase [Rhodanobacteraceae bacterium]|nr:diguanylate cyclase [Rhodanobacteraceae bacterium]